MFQDLTPSMFQVRSCLSPVATPLTRYAQQDDAMSLRERKAPRNRYILIEARPTSLKLANAMEWKALLSCHLIVVQPLFE